MIKLLRKIKNILETSRTLSRFFDVVAGSYLYKKVAYHRIRKYIQRIKESKRYNVIIETSTICNARCVMCPHVKMKRRMGVMTDETFDLILKKLKSESIRPLAFILNGFGDPLTDKKIFERIKRIKIDFPESVVKFYSNLGLADEKIIGELVTSGLDEINISFNGYSKENYERTMGIGYEKTLDNLKKLIRKRKEEKSPLKIRLSMTLVSYNDGDEAGFIKKWSRYVDSVSVNKVHTYNDSVSDVSGQKKINFKKLAYPCKYIWNTIVFGATGDVYLCCLDYEGEHSFGNIREKGVLEMFYSENFERIRQKHLENDIKNIKICSACYTPFKNGVEWFVDELY